MESKYTYEAAFAELQQIVGHIESGDINVDDLAIKIGRAAELISICKAKLTATEEEVDKLLAKLQEEKDEVTPASEEEE